MVEENSIPSIINGKVTKEDITTSIIHTNNDKIEHDLDNSKSASKYEFNFTSKNDVYNNNVEHEFGLQHCKIDSKNK